MTDLRCMCGDPQCPSCGVAQGYYGSPAEVQKVTLKPCGESLRGGSCKLDTGHKGPHSIVAYCCDGCGKMRRGRPWRHGPEGLGFCFLCCIENKKWMDEWRSEV